MAEMRGMYIYFTFKLKRKYTSFMLKNICVVKKPKHHHLHGALGVQAGTGDEKEEKDTGFPITNVGNDKSGYFHANNRKRGKIDPCLENSFNDNAPSAT